MHEFIKQKGKNVFIGIAKPPKGALGAILTKFDPELIIGHPTFHCELNIGGLVSRDLLGARKIFAGKRIAIIIADGTYNDKNNDMSNIEAAITGAQKTIEGFTEAEKENVLLYAGPHEGYDSARFSPGKGNAFKMMFEEMEPTGAKAIILLDGDLHNDMAPWQRVYKKVIEYHEKHFPDKNFFVTARYARHFVDASLTRNVVGPLTTLMGSYVPGGISGDIMLSAGAVAKERSAKWDDARRNYGTDIATTFDNIADPDTRIYEIYLGAKLHDVTDDAKLSIMPGQVIGAALERILHYEDLDKRITHRLTNDVPLSEILIWDSDQTNIDFINPGTTNVFNIDAKREALATKFDNFKRDLKQVLRSSSYGNMMHNHEILMKSVKSNSEEIVLMSIPQNFWIDLLYEVMGYVLVTKDIESSKKALNYLYTAAFVDFCGEKLKELGYTTLSAVRGIQENLGVSDHEAKTFYSDKVDKVVKTLAINFYSNRSKIINRMKELNLTVS
ncbi:MAG: hypothetical protein JRE27_07840 [Deltaproteobacteria bacterium]|nr:hypothetical protein [Deltaproteobacteria bacterium]